MSPRSKEVSRQMKADSRSAIITAALELFAKKGFSATTTEQIAKKARVSKGLIFNHFPTKQEILLAIIDEEFGRLLPNSHENTDAQSPKERFNSLVNSWMDMLRNKPLLVRLTLQLNLDDEYRKLMRKKGKQYVEIYFDRMRELLVELGSKNPDLDAYLLSMLFDGFASNYTVAPDLFPIDAIKDYFVEIMLARWKRRK
jgi:AcrR family transcriptional regulator